MNDIIVGLLNSIVFSIILLDRKCIINTLIKKPQQKFNFFFLIKGFPLFLLIRFSRSNHLILQNNYIFSFLHTRTHARSRARTTRLFRSILVRTRARFCAFCCTNHVYRRVRFHSRRYNFLPVSSRYNDSVHENQAYSSTYMFIRDNQRYQTTSGGT